MTGIRKYRRIARATVCIAAAGLIAAMGACGSANTTASNTSGSLHVVASINQWGSVASQIGGSRVNVTNIINSTAVEAHDY